MNHTEDSENDTKLAEKMDNNKVNGYILRSICRSMKINILIYNAKTKLKQFYGFRDYRKIAIYQDLNKFSILKQK